MFRLANSNVMNYENILPSTFWKYLLRTHYVVNTGDLEMSKTQHHPRVHLNLANTYQEAYLTQSDIIEEYTRCWETQKKELSILWCKKSNKLHSLLNRVLKHSRDLWQGSWTVQAEEAASTKVHVKVQWGFSADRVAEWLRRTWFHRGSPSFPSYVHLAS